MVRRAPRDASTCLGATQAPFRLVPVQYSLGLSTGPIDVASQVLRFRVRSQLSQSRCLSFLRRCLDASTSYFLHAAINLRPPSVTVSTRTPASNASLSSHPPCQTPGSRSVRNRSTLSSSHPVLSALYPQGFQARFVLATVHRSFG